MGNARAMEVTRKLTKSGGLVDYGRDLSRLLVRVMPELAQGSHLPKTTESPNVSRNEWRTRCCQLTVVPLQESG